MDELNADTFNSSNHPTIIYPSDEDFRNRRVSESASFDLQQQNFTYEKSTRSLLHKKSSTTINEFEIVRGIEGGDEDGPRQRIRFRSNLHDLMHRKSVVSQRTTSTFDGHFAHGKPGWWKKQMLVDRSLRSMAAFTALCAAIMFVIVLSYLKAFKSRVNLDSTSVGGKDGESCETAERRNLVCLDESIG